MIKEQVMKNEWLWERLSTAPIPLIDFSSCSSPSTDASPGRMSGATLHDTESQSRHRYWAWRGCPSRSNRDYGRRPTPSPHTPATVLALDAAPSSRWSSRGKKKKMIKLWNGRNHRDIVCNILQYLDVKCDQNPTEIVNLKHGGRVVVRHAVSLHNVAARVHLPC